MEETIRSTPEKLKHSEQSSTYKSVQDPSGHAAFSPGIVRRLREKVAGEDDLPDITDMLSLSGHSNEIVRLGLDDGRSLMVKRARFDWTRICSGSSGSTTS